MFLLVYALGQAGRRVIRLYRYHCLYDQWSAIEFLADEVHAAAMLAVTGVQRPLMGVQAFVFRQQRRVDIQQAAGVVTNETGGENAHKPGQYHQLRIKRINSLDQRGIEGFTAVELLVIEHGGVDAGLFGDRKNTRLNSTHSQISYAVFCLKKK